MGVGLKICQAVSRARRHPFWRDSGGGAFHLWDIWMISDFHAPGVSRRPGRSRTSREVFADRRSTSIVGTFQVSSLKTHPGSREREEAVHADGISRPPCAGVVASARNQVIRQTLRTGDFRVSDFSKELWAAKITKTIGVVFPAGYVRFKSHLPNHKALRSLRPKIFRCSIQSGNDREPLRDRSSDSIANLQQTILYRLR